MKVSFLPLATTINAIILLQAVRLSFLKQGYVCATINIPTRYHDDDATRDLLFFMDLNAQFDEAAPALQQRGSTPI
jgi:hypothetical protein